MVLQLSPVPRARVAKLSLVSDIVDQLGPLDGFKPISIVADAFPSEPRQRKGNQLTRSFRYELEGCAALVHVHGSRRSAWRRRLVAHLEAAGYDSWLVFADETVCRRWVTGKRARAVEFRLVDLVC